METKTVCFFNSTQAWGGGEKWHFDMATRLASASYRVVVCTHPRSALYERLRDTGLKVYPVSISNLSFLNPFQSAEITRILRREKVDTLIMNLSADVKIAGPAARRAGVKHIIYRRGLAAPIKNRALNRYLFRQVITDVICNSEETRRMIFAHNAHMIAPEKVHVLYNGIDLQACEPTVPAQPGGTLIIGNAGRFVPQKGQHHLIEMARILKDRGLKFQLIIAGTGKLEADLKALAVREGVAEEVVFPGFVDDIPGFMHSIDLFVLTSYWEGFGYVLVEAMACARPVVAFDISSNPEIVAEGETGFLVSAGDSAAMAGKVLLLAENESLRRQMGLAGRQRVEERFDIRRTVHELEALLQRA